MQNKGLVKVFAILFGLVCIYQLSFTFIASSVEGEAKEFAIQQVSDEVEDYAPLREAVEQRYLDSIGNQNIIAGITYNDAKEKELNRGLDLKGGINVILQVSVKDILRTLSNNSSDPAFNQALAQADQAQRTSQDDYIDLFFDAFEQIPDARLASPDIFANKDLSAEIDFNMSNNEVKPIIRRKIDEAISSAFEIIRNRIDRFGVTQPNIQRLGTSGRILVELPGAKDIERVQGLLQSTAELEFWHVYNSNQFQGFFAQANNLLKELSEDGSSQQQVEDDTTATGDDEIDALLASAEDSAETAEANPLFDLMVQPVFQGPVIATFRVADTAQVNDYLQMSRVRSLLPADKRYTKFAWGIAEGENDELTSLYALAGNRQNEPPLSGGVVTDAVQTFDQVGRVAVSMQMNGQGARVWEQMTGQAFSNRTSIAIVLDDIVYSAPGVSSGPISGGRSEITGNFTVAEGQDLANVLKAGQLPASADIVQSEVVGPSLGQEAIDAGMMSFIIALVLVLIWMIFYYGKAGGFADIALLVNILFIFGVLAGLGAVLTLPGIAGIVLTIGMAVDANVLIFERIREELHKGKSQVDAIRDGFSNALSSILDANITTGLTGIILFVVGTGPIKGFATTLLIGIATSLFTSIFITRLFIDGYGKSGKKLEFSTAPTKGFLQDVNVNFMDRRKVGYIISSVLVAISLISLLTQGLNPGVDFVGGRSYTVRFEQSVSPTEIQNSLEEAIGSAEVKTFGAANQVRVTTKYKVEEEGTEVDREIQQLLYNSLQSYLPQNMSFDDFLAGGSDTEYGIMQTLKIGPSIADDIKQASIWGVIGSLVVIFLYILLRFRRWQFSFSSVLGLTHDVLIILGIFSLTYRFMPFSMEIDQAFMAAILTVIGYSLNDTVVVFDRIREYFNDHPGWKTKRLINSAVSSTLGRTMNTSLTTLVVMLSIFIFGGESIRGFMFAMIIGVVVGTYSTIFFVSPLTYDTMKKRDENLKLGEEKKVPRAKA